MIRRWSRAQGLGPGVKVGRLTFGTFPVRRPWISVGLGTIFSAVGGPSNIETDYLVVGAGALGMGFVDALIQNSDADIVVIDGTTVLVVTGSTPIHSSSCTSRP